MWTHVNAHWHACVHPCQGGLNQRVTWTHGKAASIMAPGEAEMMDMVCRWEWTPRAWGHCWSTALPPLPSVSTGWAQTHDRGLGQTHISITFNNTHLTLGAKWAGQHTTHKYRSAHLHSVSYNSTHFCSEQMIVTHAAIELSTLVF